MISSQFVFKFALFAVSSWGVLPLANAEPLFITTDIFPPGVKHTHSSSIVQCPNGDLLACWFHGSGERTADDVLVQGARLKKGAKRWSP
ncbi:MAG: sialidase family protein, partial [Verrucomicrobiota bacterium]|nr:sialidase family protein [Verrucomicrobiota bacterium]